MFEIYDHYADRYDELVRAEDWQGNFARLVQHVVDWRAARVLEAGVGSGRVTQLYVESAAHATCTDRAAHMLEYAAGALAAHADKLTFLNAANEDLPLLPEPVDVFIQGWSFGHSVVDAPAAEVPKLIDALVAQARKNLRPGGAVIMIETLGTNVAAPHAPHPHLNAFYARLESVHGFERHTVATDYRFASRADAQRVLGFFFGAEMAQALAPPDDAAAAVVIPEWTGVWVQRVP